MSHKLPDFDAARFRICAGPCGTLKTVLDFFNVDTGRYNDVCHPCLKAAKVRRETAKPSDDLTFDKDVELWQLASRAAGIRMGVPFRRRALGFIPEKVTNLVTSAGEEYCYVAND
jgi:hypothetical protein